MKNFMQRFVLQIIFGVSVLVASGCARQPTLQSVKEPSEPERSAAVVSLNGDRPCVVSGQVFVNHIKPRHCDLNQFVDKSKLVSAYCTSAAAAQNFCRMVQNAPNVTRVVQSDGRIRYDADLAVVVGTNGETRGRVIITGVNSGDVVTEFPEL